MLITFWIIFWNVKTVWIIFWNVFPKSWNFLPESWFLNPEIFWSFLVFLRAGGWTGGVRGRAGEGRSKTIKQPNTRETVEIGFGAKCWSKTFYKEQADISFSSCSQDTESCRILQDPESCRISWILQDILQNPAGYPAGFHPPPNLQDSHNPAGFSSLIFMGPVVAPFSPWIFPIWIFVASKLF